MNRNLRKIFIAVSIIILLSFLDLSSIFFNRNEIRSLGEFFGLLSYGFFSLTLFFSVRSSSLEKFFGGLDQMARFHHGLGITTFILILIHPLVMSLSHFYFDPYWIFNFFLPLHHRFEVNLGVVAFWLLFFIILLTLFKILPYHRWKLIHRGLSIVYLLVTFHWLISDYFYPTFTQLIFLALGLFSIGFQQFYYPFWKKKEVFEVKSIKKISSKFLEVELNTQKLSYHPGQYYFSDSR